jgi:hypothetical protein
MCPAAPDLTSLLRVLMLPRVPRLLTHLHAEEGSGAATCPAASDPRLPAGEGSGVATCSAAPDPDSSLWRALTLPHVPLLSVGCGPQV